VNRSFMGGEESGVQVSKAHVPEEVTFSTMKQSAPI